MSVELGLLVDTCFFFFFFFTIPFEMEILTEKNHVLGVVHE